MTADIKSPIQRQQRLREVIDLILKDASPDDLGRERAFPTVSVIEKRVREMLPGVMTAEIAEALTFLARSRLLYGNIMVIDGRAEFVLSHSIHRKLPGFFPIG